MNNDRIDIILSGPRRAEKVALGLSAYNVRPMLGDVGELAQQLVNSSDSGLPRWRSYRYYGLLYIEGPHDLDVAPYLPPLREWLACQSFATRIVTLDATPERLLQIRSVFPDVYSIHRG